jgi:hypothetical protein
MIPSVRFQAVLDTNVIYPLISRDLLFWFAHYDLYAPKWSKHIFDEWEEVMIRSSKLNKVRSTKYKVRSSILPSYHKRGIWYNYLILIT